MYKNLKNEYPEVPESFHNNVLNTLDRLPERFSEVKRRRSPVKIQFLWRL